MSLIGCRSRGVKLKLYKKIGGQGTYRKKHQILKQVQLLTAIKSLMILQYQILKGNMVYSFIHWILHLFILQSYMHFKKSYLIESRNTQVIGCSVDSKHTLCLVEYTC